MNISLALTIIRLVCGPLFFTILMCINYESYLLAISWITLMGLTDYLDGSLARHFRWETMIGKILDPIADKLFIITCFIIATALNRIHFAWVVLLVGREIVVMGARRCATWYGFEVPVHRVAKLKTVIQFILLILLFGFPQQYGFLYGVLSMLILVSVGTGALYVSLVYKKACEYEI